MSEDVQTKYHTYMQNYRTAVSSVTHAASLFPDGTGDLNDLYFSAQSAFETMVRDLKTNNIIDNAKTALDDFLMYGFPRTVPNFPQVVALVIFIEDKKTNWNVKLQFFFKNDKQISYITDVEK